MSIPASQRPENKLEAFSKARELALWTMNTLRNKRVFPSRFDYVNKQVADLAWSIPRSVWTANNILVDRNRLSESEYAVNCAKRKHLQQKAIRDVNELLFELQMIEKIFCPKRKKRKKGDDSPMTQAELEECYGYVLEGKIAPEVVDPEMHADMGKNEKRLNRRRLGVWRKIALDTKTLIERWYRADAKRLGY